MMGIQFDHENLDVYKVSIEFVAWVWHFLKDLPRNYKNPRDQLIRSSQSIPTNIAEGNGKRSSPDRKRYFEIARGSAMESAATLDILVSVEAKLQGDIQPGKVLLARIVSMLTKMAPPG